MNKRARALMSITLTLVFGVLILFVARPAYAKSMFTLSVNGARTTINSLADLQKKLNAEDGKNRTIIIDFNSDVTGGPLELPSKSTITINLNSHTLNRGLKKADSKGHALLVKKNSKVTINGGTNIDTKPVNAWNKDGHNIGWRVEASGLITGGYSTNKAGGIHLNSGARLTLNDVTVAGNRAEQKSGSDGYGGGIWACGSDTMVSLNNSQICHNYAYNDGGGICSTSSQFNLFMNNSKVQFNGAKRNGGGIALRASKAVVAGDQKTVVSYNNCYGTYGGGVYINKDSVSVGGFTVEGNEAKYGGGVATRDHSITLSSLTIKSNVADYGGGVYVGDFTNVKATASDTMNGCVITKNKTTNNSSWGKGAGVYVVGGGRGLFVKAFSLEVGGKTIVKDNGAGSGNFILGSTSVHPNFTLTGESDVRMGYEKISENAVQVTHDRLKGPNCIRYLTPENGGYHFTYNPSASSRKIFYVKNGKDNETKYGSTYGQRQTVGKITPAAAASKVDGSKSYNGYPVTRGYVRFPSVVEEKIDLATPFFYSDGYFFDDPKTYSPHLATASMCMAMSGFYLNTGDIHATGGYVNKHASARQFMADIGCDDQSIFVNDFNVQKPGIDTIGVTIAHKRLKNKDGKDSDYYLIPVAIRGANYEAEWTSNVTLNKASSTFQAKAAGFDDAADKVYNEVYSYMRRYKIPADKARLWVAGYSRAGATTNLLCKRLIDNFIGTQIKVFGYPMEAPQGGTNKGIDDLKYYSIHNVINQADLVPLVAPSAMGFKRYGLDHYIPGSNAGTPHIAENEAVLRGGTGGPARRYVHADNFAYQTSMIQYNNAGAIAQLKAIDPNIVFDDYFATCGMDFAPSPSIYEKSTGKVSVFEERFIKDFLNEVQAGAISNRDVYANDLEPTFRTVMGMLFGMEPSRTKAFVDRASTTMNRFDTLIASWNDHGMFRIWWSLIGEWNKSNADKKKEYTDLFYKKLKETEALDVLTKEERAKFDAAWPKLFDFIMRVLDRDYNTTSYDTAKMMMLGTFAYNSSRIMANHYPEVTLAWLRTYDDYYKNERASTVITNAPSVSAPSASVGKTNLKAGGQVNTIPGGKQTVKLDVTNLKGEAIYYKMSGTKTSANTCKNGYEIYRGGIDLGKVNKDAQYTITAYAVSYGTKSAEVTYKIKATGAPHKVVVYNEHDAQRKKISETYEWTEGSKQTVEAKEADNWQFVAWKVWNEKGADFTGEVLGNDSTKKTVTFTMPEGGKDGLSENYTLTFAATFKWKPKVYPKHDFTVRVGDSIETFKVAENQTFKYDATSKIPAGKCFKEWKVTVNDNKNTNVTGFMRPAFRRNIIYPFKWGSINMPNMYCEVIENNQTIYQSDGTYYTFAQGYSLTFEAKLEDIVNVDKIDITDVGQAMQYGSSKATIKYYAGENEKNSLSQYAYWKRSQGTQKNEDTTVTTTTTYETVLNCPAVAGNPFAADDKLSVRAQVNGQYVDNDQAYKVAWKRKNNGTIQVSITKTESKTTGTPTYTYDVTANACDKNDASRSVLRQGDQNLTKKQSFKAGKDGVFRFYNGPYVSDGKFCGYEAAEGSGLVKMNTDNPYDNTFKVDDKDKPLTVNMLYVPEISEIEVTSFPQPVTGETLASADSEGIDFAYILPQNSAFTKAFATQIKSLNWSPAPGEDQKAAADTAYTAELELGCVKDGQPYECAFAQGGVSVTTSGVQPAFESAEFDPAASKLYLTFKRTDRSTDHKVSVKSNADDGDPTTYTWKEGEVKTIAAKDDYDDQVFESWAVTVTNGESSVSATNEQLQAMGLDTNKLKQPKLTLTMPTVSDQANAPFSKGYALSLTANYHNKAELLNVTIGEPTGSTTDLDETAELKWEWGDGAGQSKTVTADVEWTVEGTVAETTSNRTFKATMVLGADDARQLVRSNGEPARPTVQVNGSGVGTATWNADGSLTITATFELESTLPAYKVNVGAYDANSPESKLKQRKDETTSQEMPSVDRFVVDEKGDSDGFTLSAPVIPGAEFVRWEIPAGSKIVRVEDTSNKFRFNGATAEDTVEIHALYKPVVKAVELDVDAPVAAQQLATSATAQIELVNADAFVNKNPNIATTVTWTPSSAEGKAAYDSEYDAAVTLAYTYKKRVDEQEQDVNWLCGYANDVVVTCANGSQAWFERTANVAHVLFPSTERDNRHQVTIRNFADDDTPGTQRQETWYEGETKHLVAKQYGDKIFTGWTIMRTVASAENKDVTNAVLANGAKATDVAIAVTVPVAAETGDFPEGYGLTITANYTNKFGAITATVPQPSINAQQLPNKAALKWGEGQGQSAEVDLWWEWQGQTEQNEANKIIKDTYTAIMQLDADKAQKFKSAVTVTGVAAGTGDPQVKANGSTWTWNPDGSATITVEFNPIVTNVEARKVVAQACDVNANGQSKIEGTTDEEVTLFVDETGPFAVYAPEVEGAEFVSWDVPANVTKVDAPEPDPQDGTNVSEDGPTVGFFKFKDGAPITTDEASTYTIKALYKPVVDVVRVKFAAPKAGQTMAKKDDATASFTLQNGNFSKDFAVSVGVKTLEWSPEVGADGTADYNTAYTATVTLAPDTGKQFVYAADLLPDYEVPGEGDEDDAAMVRYIGEGSNNAGDPAHTMYVNFYATEQAGLQSIIEPSPIVVTNDKNNAQAIKDALHETVDIEVAGTNGTISANVTWDDPVCDEYGGKAYESFWHAEGTVTLPEGVTPPAGVEAKDLKVSVLIYVQPADKLNLLDVEKPADLLDVDPNSIIKQQLPTTTTLTMEDGVQEEVAVEWNDPVLVENGEDVNVSVWKVTGRVKEPLPNWINNPTGEGHVDLSLSLNVYVNPPDRRHEPADTPYATLDDGIYNLSQVIYLDTYNPNARIYYTTDIGAGLEAFKEYVPGTPISLDRSTVDKDGIMAIQAYAVEEGKDPSEVVSYVYLLDEVAPEAAQLPVTYSGHVQNKGDIKSVSNGATLGTTGKSLRLEALKATVQGGSIEYRAHVQNVGWQKWVKDGVQAGTTGRSLRLEALQMRLSEELQDAGYHVWYRVHVQNIGWMGWACDGMPAGTTGHGLRAEAVQILVLHGANQPDDHDPDISSFRARVLANAHVQRDGWLGYGFFGRFGTTGQSKRLEAMWMKAELPFEGGIDYQAHVQNIGWQDWASDGAVAGTTGRSLRMEAARLELTGEASEHLSVWYRAHVQNLGWTDWTCDGEVAGTTGRCLRAEAFEVAILSAGADPNA